MPRSKPPYRRQNRQRQNARGPQPPKPVADAAPDVDAQAEEVKTETSRRRGRPTRQTAPPLTFTLRLEPEDLAALERVGDRNLYMARSARIRQAIHIAANQVAADPGQPTMFDDAATDMLSGIRADLDRIIGRMFPDQQSDSPHAPGFEDLAFEDQADHDRLSGD